MAHDQHLRSQLHCCESSIEFRRRQFFNIHPFDLPIVNSNFRFACQAGGIRKVGGAYVDITDIKRCS
ncbi:unnamed protein product [Lasius platythorax]|uniref:Uncharacterized protein n=1 Tax=Lasius platythorax TaxID=488582 RepID=A0AAV2NA67_9HYME